MELTFDMAKDTIYRYDSSCQGFLDFDDFLHVCRDIEVVLEQNWLQQNPEEVNITPFAFRKT